MKTANLVKQIQAVLVLVIATFLMASCNETGGGESSPRPEGSIGEGAPSRDVPSQDQPNGEKSPEVIPPPPSIETMTNVQVGYFKRTQTFAPINGWVNKTYTASGSCLVHKTQMYCWDDGVQTIQSWVYLNYTYPSRSYTYFEMRNDNSSSGFNKCSGACTDSYFSIPKKMLQHILINAGQGRVADIFTHGEEIVENCQESTKKLACETFSIDL